MTLIIKFPNRGMVRSEKPARPWDLRNVIFLDDERDIRSSDVADRFHMLGLGMRAEFVT